MAVAQDSKQATKRHAPFGAAFKLEIRNYEERDLEVDCADSDIDSDCTGDDAGSDVVHVKLKN